MQFASRPEREADECSTDDRKSSVEHPSACPACTPGTLTDGTPAQALATLTYLSLGTNSLAGAIPTRESEGAIPTRESASVPILTFFFSLG